MKSLFGEKDHFLRQAQSHIHKSEFKEAEQKLNAYMTKAPDIYGQLYLAVSIHSQGRTNEALGILQDAIKQNPPEPEIFIYFRALFYFDTNDFNHCLNELKKIKNPNSFHEILKSIAIIFKEFADNNKDYSTAYKILKKKKCHTVSTDLQARILYKLESYLTINLAKRAYTSTFSFSWKPILFAKYRIAERTNFQKELLEKSLVQADAKEFGTALELIEKCFQMNLDNNIVEDYRVKISMKIVENLEQASAKLPVHEVLWAFFFSQQFQKGIDIATPYLAKHDLLENHSTYLEIIDIVGYLNFSLGKFNIAENLLKNKIRLDPKNAEQASYFFAACLQHTKKQYEAINAYKDFINNHLSGFETHLNCAMKTLSPGLITY